jgi:DNA-binding IclR family transcriptional regulator
MQVAARAGKAEGETLQTLQRGIWVLDLLRENPSGLTISQIASRLEVHRTIVNRLLTTLLNNGLIIRDPAGRYALGPAIARYSVSIAPQLREVALVELRALTSRHGVTAVLHLADNNEVAVLETTEPTGTDYFVGTRVGSRHPLGTGAGGIAILAARRAEPDDASAVRRARAQGYAVTRGELNQGVLGIFAPIRLEDGWVEASIGILSLKPMDTDLVGADVVRAAGAIAQELLRESSTALAGPESA